MGSIAIRKAQSLEEVLNYQQEVLGIADFKIEEIAFSEQEEWLVDEGRIRHKSGGFFEICGHEAADGQQNLVLHQPQGAFNGLLICRNDDTIYVLIQARIEPGNTHVCQYGPTVQSTPANYLQVHKGKATAYIDYFFGDMEDGKVLHRSDQTDLGQRYFQKTKELKYVELDSLKATAENMIWVSLDTLWDCLHQDHLINTDLRSMLGVFDWDEFLNSNPISQPNLPNLPSIEMTAAGSLIPLDALTDWTVNERGVWPNNAADISVKMYRTSCTNREVKTWTQPLIGHSEIAHYTLCIREMEGIWEALISVENEMGCKKPSLMPSFHNYAGQNSFKLGGKADRVLSVEQSEEGGRFFQNNGLYEVVILREEIKINENQVWMPVLDFKSWLKSSENVSIQLRGMASMIFPVLNPIYSTTNRRLDFLPSKSI